MVDKELIKHFILECKLEKEGQERYRQNVIQFNDYFKYSGKVEEKNSRFK